VTPPLQLLIHAQTKRSETTATPNLKKCMFLSEPVHKRLSAFKVANDCRTLSEAVSELLKRSRKRLCKC